MQHPDEGMIHSWLDGALSAEEAAEVQAHVAKCPSCPAAVAEARGFIAASSRILTALDDVPRGVLPVVPARHRDLRVFWRAAAAMLVVAGGSLVVMREDGQDAGLANPATREVVALSPAAPAPSPDAAGTSAVSAPTRTDERIRSQPPAAVQPKPMSTPSRILEGRAAGSVQDLSKESDLRRASEPASVVVGGTGTADAVVPGRGTTQQQANVVLSEIEAMPLKVLKVERTLGSRRTTYEIAPSQTVTLTEPEPMQRSEVRMTTGRAAAQRQATTGGARAAQPMAAEAASAPPPAAPMMDSRAGTDSTSVRDEASSAAKTSPSAAFVAVSNTISWRDPQTGQTLTLSGNVSVERLQEIRKRIEKERAAANKTVP